jgi:hypothetical protein
MFHMMLEMEYIMLMILVLDMYYLVHHFQIYLRVRVAPPMLGTHIIEDWSLFMWAINDLEWREYLSYYIVCCYIQYHQPRGYNALEFEVGCLGLYVLWHYCKLEITYEDYYCHHQTFTSNQPTYVLDHVKSITKDQPEKWEHVMSNR